MRFNLYRAVEIQGTQAPGYSSGQALDALEDVARKTLPLGMGYSWNGLSHQQKVTSGGAARVLGLSLVFVFLILAALNAPIWAHKAFQQRRAAHLVFAFLRPARSGGFASHSRRWLTPDVATRPMLAETLLAGIVAPRDAFVCYG